MLKGKKLVEKRFKVMSKRKEISEKNYIKKYKPENYTPRKFEFSIPWKPRLEIFKYKRRSEVTFNPETLEAESYGHWRFVWESKGKIIFNNYRYSKTTTDHQSMVETLLSQLNLKPFLMCDLGRSGTLDTQYYKLFQAQIEEKRPNALKRTHSIREALKNIQLGKKLGLKTQESPKEIKRRVEAQEKARIQEMKERAQERKALRDKIKAIQKADPSTLKSQDLHRETNVEVRKALINRIGIAKVLSDLKAKVLDTQGEYQLVDLQFATDSDTPWAQNPRPYLKMKNPSTGEIHVEGVAPHCQTVQEALAWRNGMSSYDFNKPVRLT